MDKSITTISFWRSMSSFNSSIWLESCSINNITVTKLGVTGVLEGLLSIMVDVYLRQLHLHMCKNVQETNNCIPQATVSQTLLIPCARALKPHNDYWDDWIPSAFFPHVEDRPYLNVLCESVEDLFGYIDCFGEIPLALFIDDVFPRIVPVEITDGLLRTCRTHVSDVCYQNVMEMVFTEEPLTWTRSR